MSRTALVFDSVESEQEAVFYCGVNFHWGLEFAVEDMSTNKKKEARILLQDSRDDLQASFHNFIVIQMRRMRTSGSTEMPRDTHLGLSIFGS
jgi:hypothetical protein